MERYANGINQTTVLSSEIEAMVDKISDAVSELLWEFRQQQEYNRIFHFQLTCWEVKERQNGRSKKVRHENFPNGKIDCLYYWNFMKATCVPESGKKMEQREKLKFCVISCELWRAPPSSLPWPTGVPGEGGACISFPSAFAWRAAVSEPVPSPHPWAVVRSWNKVYGVKNLGVTWHIL